MTELVCKLVGAHFRPPAKWIIAALPARTPLTLQHEPSNPYDEKAIMVLVEAAQVLRLSGEARKFLISNCQGAGVDLESFLAENENVHLGYLPDSDGKDCVKNGLPGNREVAALRWPLVAVLGFEADGKPLVRVREQSDAVAAD